MSFVSTLELSRRKKPHELNFCFLPVAHTAWLHWWIGSWTWGPKISAFLCWEVARWKVGWREQERIPASSCGVELTSQRPYTKINKKRKKNIGLKARRYNQYWFQIYALSNSSFTLSKSSKLIEIHFLRSSSDHQNNSITSLLGFDVKFYFLAVRQKTENLLSTEIFEPKNLRTDYTTQLEIVNCI